MITKIFILNITKNIYFKMVDLLTFIIAVVQSLSCVWLFVTTWAVARQVSLSFIIPWSLLKFMSIEWAMLSNHLILCCPLLHFHSIFPSIRVFSNDWAFALGGLSIGASASVFPMNIQGWFPLGLTGLISFQSKGHIRVFSSTTIWKF